MIKIAIIIAGILLLVILGLLFRVGVLSAVFSGSYRKQVGRSNKVNAFLCLAFLILGGVAFWWSWVASAEEMEVPLASVHGKETDYFFWLTMGVIGFVFVITQVLLFWYAFKYQHSEDRRAYYYPHNNKLELFWTAVPAVVMALLVFQGWKTWTKITSAAPKNCRDRGDHGQAV